MNTLPLCSMFLSFFCVINFISYFNVKCVSVSESSTRKKWICIIRFVLRCEIVKVILQQCAQRRGKPLCFRHIYNFRVVLSRNNKKQTEGERGGRRIDIVTFPLFSNDYYTVAERFV